MTRRRFRAKHIILLGAGFLCLGLGTAGIFLPVMPTTPFVILAAVCFSNSSPRMLAWLQKNRYFASYIENYRLKTGVPRSVKMRSLIFLWAALAVSAIAVRTLPVIVILTAVGAAVTVHILLIKTKEK